MLAVNETRLHEIIADNEVSIDGYNIVRRDRPLNGRNGGGVCFYVRSNINYNVHKDLIFDQLESLTTEISKPRSKSFIVATWYRPPNSPFELYFPILNLLLESWMLKGKSITLWTILIVLCSHQL